MPGWINLFSGHSNPAGWPLGGAFAWATTGYRSPSARYAPHSFASSNKEVHI